MKSNVLPVFGACLWIIGLILFVLGLNIHTTAGQWMTVAGEISFLIGLGREGVYWMKNRKGKEEKREQGVSDS